MDDRWFIRNVAEMPALAEPPFGAYIPFAPQDRPVRGHRHEHHGAAAG